MTGPYFTKPTLRNVLCNVPLTISFITFIFLSKAVHASWEVVYLICPPAIVASAFVSGAYDVLRRKATFITFPISLVISAVISVGMLYMLKHDSDPPLWLSYLDATSVWILCVVLCLLAAPILTFLINWMMLRDDESQSECLDHFLKGKKLKILVWICLAVSVVLFAVLLFNPCLLTDDGFTLHLVSLSYSDGIDMVAYDGNPPLYYIMLKAWLSALSFGSNDIYVIIVLSRLFSLVAYVLTALLCLKKLQGGEWRQARWLLLLCLCAFFELVRYGVEIRMYSWALFFVTATFLYARDVMSGKGDWKTWLIITLFSVCAAYTHYYALISVSIIWLILLVWICLHDRRMLLRLFVCGIIVVLAFLPWLMSLLHQLRLVSEHFWIDLSVNEFILTCIFLFIPVHTILPFLFVKVLRNKDGRISFDDIMGLCVLLGTFAIGMALSLTFRPVFISRYLFPSALCMWFSLLLIFRHARSKERFILVGILMFGFILSNGKKVSSFVLDCKDIQATRLLLDTIDNDAVFAFATDTIELDSQVLSCFTDNGITTWQCFCNTLGEKRAKLMFPNVTDFETREDMWRYLRTC
ncbi:MAG: hypothetical protein LUC88_03610, partial [Prevotella sp.]|nr:hypothetical protein [Prevotella sp.]